jgi:hypothetical protein
MSRAGVPVVLALAVALAHSSPGVAASIKTVALQGNPAPSSGTFKKFREPVIGDGAGTRVAVYVKIRGVGGKRCLFELDPDGGPDAVIACERDPSPDGATFTRIAFDPTITATNAVAWSSRLSFGRSGVYREGPAVVALLGDPVPVPGTGLLKLLTQARITATSDVVFHSTISGGAVVLGVEVNQGIFRCTGGDGNCSSGTGTLETLLLVNDPVADRPGREFCSFGKVVAGTFGIAFRGVTKLDCADGGETPLTGVFRKPFVGPVVTVALEGETSNPFPAPGGTLYGALTDALSMNDTGSVAFRASTTGVLNAQHLFLCDSATCPATPAEAAVTSGDVDDASNAFLNFSPPAVSAAGDIAFVARLFGSTRSGAYIRRTTDDIETIAVAFDTIPDLPPPGSAFFQRFNPPGMSPGGKVAFRAKLRWSVSTTSRYGVFAFE